MVQDRNHRRNGEAEDDGNDQLRRWQIAILALRVGEIVYQLVRDHWSCL